MHAEINGFDESGIIGENLRFIRVGIEIHNELRPFVYNLLHFGSLVVTKAMLKGHPPENQKAYVRAVLNDPAIDVNHYAFPPIVQLDLLRAFTLCEFNRVADKRRELITHFKSTDLQETVSKVIDYFRKYNDPWGYTERFIKSYAYRMIIEDLQRTSKILSNRFINNYKVISLVDGGFPLIFWVNNFLKPVELMGPSRFSKEKTPIYGISNGDEYYPPITIAGNVATITNRFYEMIYPQSVKEIPRPENFSLEDYCKEYERFMEKPKFLPRILFIGCIDANLQYSIPFILSKKTGMFFEPFRVLFDETGSFRSFYKRFRGDSKNDIVICGKIKTPQENSMYQECKNFDLKMIDAKTFFSDFENLLDKIDEEAKGSNLDRNSLTKITLRLDKIKEIVKKTL
jgi:hypothetical protein